MGYTQKAIDSIDLSNKDIAQYNKDMGAKPASNMLLGAVIHLMQGYINLEIEKNLIIREQNAAIRENSREIKSLKNMLKKYLQEKQGEQTG